MRNSRINEERNMNILIVDISGRVDIYDDALFTSMKSVRPENKYRLLRPKKGLLNLIPNRFKTSESLLKRLVKVFEALLNYLFLLASLVVNKYDVLHFQWLPFLEVNEWEISFLKIIRRIAPKTKIALTVHNIYPHNINDKAKLAYNCRFRKACTLIDEFIVHTNISKQDIIKEFGICVEKVSVCCHGVFAPEGVKLKRTNREGGKLHILQFGSQSFYKGTDLLVDAVCGLDISLQNKIDIHIVGGISNKFLSELQRKDKKSIVKWTPFFIDNQTLYKEINQCDLIVLPYRAISQSGVLLLSIYFEKLIICSDLPSFKETMHGSFGTSLDDMLFFKSEDSDALKQLLVNYINKLIDESLVHNRIANLKALYSWESAAKATIATYRKVLASAKSD